MFFWFVCLFVCLFVYLLLARIHETNLKKQGLLALTFDNADDYDKVQTGDKISLKGLKNFSPGSQFELIVKKTDGTIVDGIKLNHTFNDEQIEWFKAGSCLNYMKQQLA